MSDKVIKIGNSIIQHGKYNNRIYIMHLSREDIDEVKALIDKLLAEFHYTKVFIKCPADLAPDFVKNGYITEAVIPDFYHKSSDCNFLGLFLDDKRKILEDEQKLLIEDNLSLCKDKANAGTISKNKIEVIKSSQLSDLAELYSKVFASYPFPIFDQDYLFRTLDHVVYYGIYHQDRLVAASSAELDWFNRNAEMTDFATLEEFRGRGMAQALLKAMEYSMNRLHINTVYTIARAYSAGMNITFSRAGYIFAGTLINNTQISGNIESMNVWYKNLLL